MHYTKTVLDNGVRVITVPMEGNPTVTVMVMVGTGSFYEEAKERGLSHFLEHMCFKGTTKRPSSLAITTELDSLGASYNAFTGEEFTGYYAKAATKHFDKIGDVVVDIYKNSIFPEGELAKEKGVVKGEIDMYADDPQEKVSDALHTHMYKGEQAEVHILGTKETVDAVTREDLINYRNLQYKANNTLIVMAGGVEEEKMIAFAKASLSDMKKGETRAEFATKDRAQIKAELVVVDKDTDQAHIVMAWRTFPRNDERRFSARILKAVLSGGMSSRLFIKLRDDMGSGYYVRAGHDNYKSHGAFSIATGTTAARVSEISAAILAETQKLIDIPVPAAELDKVRELILSRMRMSLETSEGVAEFFAIQELLEDKIRLPEEYEALFSKVDAAEVSRIACDLFDPKKLTVAVVGKGIDKATLAGTVGA